jgi:hypothetical protein
LVDIILSKVIQNSDWNEKNVFSRHRWPMRHLSDVAATIAEAGKYHPVNCKRQTVSYFGWRIGKLIGIQQQLFE